MTKTYLITQLEQIENAKRENRMRVTNLVLKNKELFPFLIEIVFELKGKTAIKAAWILELVCAENIELLAPHLHFFVENIKKLKHDSAVRPASKICMFLAQKQASKIDIIIKNYLTKAQIDTIIETSFDWLIGKHKVATKAYAMTSLYLLGKNTDWVHHELKLIILQNMVTESAAYKARGKMTLALINKK
ncbi:adenylosuccinate lyase [Lutibacter sp. HS1-25]|uniref:adenylosuccinate lyase n=1 Tax=Lutibacter sp. HS1-25 TaxID=2485000 RepID=UPI001011337A|nr:adenylosuccinate lyase [Lutibacter sp. HS1-25]RXP53624.1 adenylosuccinate lyase [Lutibacter sp. HS1-25]